MRIALALALTAAPAWADMAYEPAKGDDGLHDAPFLVETFKDLREDLEEAGDEGKRLLLMVEQQGCVYCNKMHEEVFPTERIAGLLMEDYFVVQVNLHGDTELVDLDGEELSEEDAVRKWGVLFTPTLIFLPEEAPEGASAAGAAVAMMPGAFSGGTTFDLLNWVRDKGYEGEEDFQRYHARMIRERDDGKTD